MTKKMALRRAIGASMIGLSAFGLAACGGGKPSEGDLKDKLAELYEAGGGGAIDGATAEKIAECAAPKMLDQVSEDGLEALMDADSSDIMNNSGEKVSKEDSDALSTISADCASSAVSGS